MKSYITLLALLVFTLVSCKKDNTQSKIPVISALEISTDSVISGSVEDTVLVSFHVIDGDGDLGQSTSSQEFDVYFKDNWGNNPFPFFFPSIPNEIVDKSKGIVADCTIKVPASQFLVLRPDPIHATGDTVRYEVWVKDRAGNESNRITTPNIYIHP